MVHPAEATPPTVAGPEETDVHIKVKKARFSSEQKKRSRMASASFCLQLLLVGSLASQLCCQHWSYGLSPGGKRDVDHLSDSVDTVVLRAPHAHLSSALLGCAEESAPFSRILGLKDILDSRADGRAKRLRTSKK